MMILIMGITIITFVLFFNPAARFSGYSRGASNYGSIDGSRVSRDQYMHALAEAELAYFFRHGSWPDNAPNSGFDARREAYYRLFLIRKLQQYGIRPSGAAVARAANEILLAMGRGQPVALDEFVSQVLTPRGVTLDDFENYLRHDLGIRQLAQVVGLSAQLVTEREARSLYQTENQELATEVVFFSGSNYLAGVAEPSAQTVAQYYTNHEADYRLPVRVQVQYVDFPITNFVSRAEHELTNLTEEVAGAFDRLGTNWVQFGNTTNEAKTAIRRELIHQRAIQDANQHANSLADTLFDLPSGQLPAFARTNHLAVRVSQPFDEEHGPADFDGGPNFATTAFSLSTNDPYGGPLLGAEAVYLIGFDKTYPSEIPPLSRIHNQVAADFRFGQAVALARAAGGRFELALTNGLARGQSFDQICAAAQVTPLKLPPFSLRTQTLPELGGYLSLLEYREIAFSTPPGKASPFLPTGRGGLVVFVEKRLPINEATMRADLPEFLSSMRGVRENEAFNAWFAREASAGLQDTPLAQPQQTGPTAGQQ